MLFIYGAGFNAHHQMTPPDHPKLYRAAGEDVQAWTKIAESESEAKVLFAGWSSTVLLIDDALHIHGHLAGYSSTRPPLSLASTPLHSHTNLKSIHGDLNGPLGLLDTSGHVHTFQYTGPRSPDTGLMPLTFSRVGNDDSPTLSHIAIAGNGKTAITMKQSSGSNMIHVLEFPNYSVFERWYADPSSSSSSPQTSYAHHMLAGRITSLIAGATCFHLLTEEGAIHSWGDGRHPGCLGRVPGKGAPAEKPVVVSALGGVKIAKIDGCGWVFGGLSESGDLYLWGRDKPSDGKNDDVARASSGVARWLGDGDEEVKLLDDDDDDGGDGKFDNVRDFAIGNGHVLVLNAAGEVWGLGENDNGQLALGQQSDGFVAQWRKVAGFRLTPGSSDIGGKIELAAGDLSSFIVSASELV